MSIACRAVLLASMIEVVKAGLANLNSKD